jgi:hypothetical protein
MATQMPQVSDAESDSKLALVQRQLSEALERQEATDEVLRIIASSPGELQPVFQAMLANATRICEAKFGLLYRFDAGQFHPVHDLVYFGGDTLTQVPAIASLETRNCVGPAPLKFDENFLRQNRKRAPLRLRTL